jgi:hypothetical protein
MAIIDDLKEMPPRTGKRENPHWRVCVFHVEDVAARSWRRVRSASNNLAAGQRLPEPVRQGVHRCFGAIAPGVARGLKLRHDHGSNYMSGETV